MSYQDTLAQLARLKGVEMPHTLPDKTDTSPFVSSVSAPAALLEDFPPEATVGSGSAEPLSATERDRRENDCERLYRALSREVQRTIPRDVSNWPDAWPIVEPPLQRMFDVAHAYTGGQEDRAELLRVAREVRHSWWEAAALYKQAEAAAELTGMAA